MKKLNIVFCAIALLGGLLSCEQEPVRLNAANGADCGGCQDVPPGGGTVSTAPSVNSFSPASGYAHFSNTGIPGTPVVVYGNNFNTNPASNSLRFNGVVAPVYTATLTELTTSVPAGATTGRITVTTNAGTATSSVDFIVLSVNAWATATSFGGLARSAAVSFVHKGLAFVGTGFTSPSNNGNVMPSKDFWMYNPNTGAWTQRADFPGAARGAAVGFATDTRGYITLGSDGTAPYTMRDLWEYHPGRNTWTQKANFPGVGRVYATAFAVSGKGYVGTGISAGGYVSDFWEYNPVSNQWTQKNNFGGGVRTFAGSFVIDKKGYVGFGQNSAFVRDVWEYDATADTWLQKASAPGSVTSGSTLLFSIGTKGYAGGSAGHFWMFDPVANQWTQKTNIPGSLVSSVSFSVDGYGYVGLGYDQIGNGNTTSFFRYTPD